MIWWMWFGKLGTYIKGKKVVDFVFSKSSKYLRIKVNFLLTKSIFRSIYKWERRESNSHWIITFF